EDGIRDYKVTGVKTCALPIYQQAKLDQELIDAIADRKAALDHEVAHKPHYRAEDTDIYSAIIKASLQRISLALKYGANPNTKIEIGRASCREKIQKKEQKKIV